jgi:hypothetical protein
VSSHGAAIRGGTVIKAWIAGAFSVHGVVVAGVGGAPVLCLPEEGRPKHPSPLDVVRNSSAESSIMAHRGDGVCWRS